MPAQPITGLPVVSTLDGTELTVYIQGGQARRATVSEVNQALNTIVQGIQEQIAAINAAPLPSLATLPGIVPPNKVGPFDDAGVNYPTLLEYGAYLSAKAGSGGGGGPSAPVVATAPSLTFPGGSGDVGENATYAEGTYTGGAVTSKDLQVEVNGAIDNTIVGITNGASVPVPTAAGQGARQLRIIERANWAGTPAVTNPSSLYTINVPVAAPVQATAPSIAPTTAVETTLLTATRGTYTVNGAPISNSLLTFEQRWTFDFGLTASLAGGATSATLSAAFPLTTGSFLIIFSNGDERTGSFTNGSTAVTWSGGLSTTATATIKVVVYDVDQSLQCQTANVGYVGRYRERPTGAGGAGLWYEASNSVTPAASGGGGDPGVSWTGLTAGQWTEITDRAAIIGDTLAAGAQAAIAAIPTTGGVTINPGDNIRTAVAGNSRVFLNGGNYTITAGGYLNLTGKELIGVAGQVVVIDLAPSFADNRYYSVYTSGSKVVNIRFENAESATFYDAGGSLYYKVLSDKPGHNITRATDGRGITVAGSGSRFVSVEFRFGFSHAAGSLTLGTYGENHAGGDADGVACRGGSNFFADAYAPRNSDDGFDLWDATAPNWFYFSSGNFNGFNTFFTGTDQYGDGNGWKWGQGSAGHHAFKCVMSNNRDWGNNLNAQTILPNLNLCSGSGNGSGFQSW